MVLTAPHEYFAPADLLLDRTHAWLQCQFHELWECYFYDVPRVNRIEIEFARPWKTRLGMISLSESGRSTYIGINSLLRDLQVPEPVCSITIAHEIAHYADGFGSPLPRKHPRPHQGNVVSRELIRRGLGQELQCYQMWTTRNWQEFYEARANGRGAMNPEDRDYVIQLGRGRHVRLAWYALLSAATALVGYYGLDIERSHALVLTALAYIVLVALNFPSVLAPLDQATAKYTIKQ